jgi:hypothetical protein
VENRRKNVLHEARNQIVIRLHLKNIRGGIMISKILVPTDGSKTAQKAAEYGVDLAEKLKASVIVLSVIDHRSFINQTVPAAQTAMHVIEPIEDYLREAAEAYAGEIRELCEKLCILKRKIKQAVGGLADNKRLKREGRTQG